MIVNAPPATSDLAWLVELNGVAAAASAPEILAGEALRIIGAALPVRLALWYLPPGPGGPWLPDQPPADPAAVAGTLQLLAAQGLGNGYHRLIDRLVADPLSYPVGRVWQAAVAQYLPDPRAEDGPDPDPPLPHAWDQMVR